MNKNIVPSIFTFINLAFGMLSIMFTFTDNYRTAAVMIICAALVDRYDGRIARRFSAESPLGKELDSLADLISFGAAPAILSWIVFLKDFGIIGYIITILFPIAGAFRLARFNVTTTKNIFWGVPITVAGAAIALDNFISLQFISHDIISTILILALTYLMVSKIKIKKI